MKGFTYCVPAAAELQAHAPNTAAAGPAQGAQQTSKFPQIKSRPQDQRGFWERSYCSIFRSDLPQLSRYPGEARKGRRVHGVGRRINSFLAEVWPSPLNTEPICPTVFEITPPDGQKGVSIVTCTFVQQAVYTGPCNSNQNSLFCDSEVGRECGSL